MAGGGPQDRGVDRRGAEGPAGKPQPQRTVVGGGTRPGAAGIKEAAGLDGVEGQGGLCVGVGGGDFWGELLGRQTVHESALRLGLHA